MEIIFRGKDVAEREKEYTELFCNPMVSEEYEYASGSPRNAQRQCWKPALRYSEYAHKYYCCVLST